ncbi:MAG: transposase, partial [Gammaproteobacteria bacterium RIFCSPHIGHO2_12_FULL_37_34]
PIDQKTAQFKNKELTPWLFKCPSQIIRNAAVNWYVTFKRFIKGQCGKPKHKPKTDKGSIHLTRELFRFDRDTNGTLRLFIGTKTNNIGYLSFKAHRKFQIPNSIYIKKECGHYSVSFCYDNRENDHVWLTDAEHLDYLKNQTADYLNDHVIGIDRGVVVPAQSNDQSFDFTIGQKKNKAKAERYIKRLQRKLARQTHIASHRWVKTKKRIANHYAKCRHIRQDFCHQTSHALVESKAKVFIFEDLKVSVMIKVPKAKQDVNGRFISNKAKQKAGLNKAILDKGWHQLEAFTRYKAHQVNKVVFKVSASYTSQECANCSHIHPDNRKSQAHFQCGYCGHVDHADRNASLVIKKRAINLILDTGTVLSAKGVLTSADIGRGAKSQSNKSMLLSVSGNESSKKKRIAATKVAA